MKGTVTEETKPPEMAPSAIHVDAVKQSSKKRKNESIHDAVPEKKNKKSSNSEMPALVKKVKKSKITAPEPIVEDDSSSVVSSEVSSNDDSSDDSSDASSSTSSDGGIQLPHRTHHIEMKDSPKSSSNDDSSDTSSSDDSSSSDDDDSDDSEADKPAPTKSKKEKPTYKAVRAERKAVRAEKAKEGAARNRAKRAQEKEDAIKAGTWKEAVQRDPYDLHPESITACKNRGEKVELPRPINPPRDSKLINMFQDGEAGKKLSVKGEKYAREKKKREMKRFAKFCKEVRNNPDDYRPDGTFITQRDRGFTQEQISEMRKAKHEAKKQEQTKVAISKKAKHELKEQKKVQRRLGRKQARAEKKRQNHEKMQAHISAKIQREKKERDEAAAAEKGITYEAYIEQKQRDLAIKKEAREMRVAEEKGQTLEEYRKDLQAHHDRKELQKEANKLNLSLDEYANQAAEPADDELGSGDEKEAGNKDGTGQWFGRSPIDRMWQKHIREKAADPTTQPNPNPAGDDYIPLDNDGPTPFMVDTAGDTSIIPPDRKRVKDMTKEERKARLEAMRARRAERAAASGIKKMSKKERRKVRTSRKEEILNKITMDIMNKRKALERAAKAPPSAPPSSKSQPRNPNETTIGIRSHNANIPPPTEFRKENPDGTLKTEKQLAKEKENAGKQEHKSSRREARRIMRGLKKGKISTDEVPASWQMRGRGPVKPKLKGNGGREPKRVADPVHKISVTGW